MPAQLMLTETMALSTSFISAGESPVFVPAQLMLAPGFLTTTRFPGESPVFVPAQLMLTVSYYYFFKVSPGESPVFVPAQLMPPKLVKRWMSAL